MEYSRVSQCESAKQIWDTLFVAHEGTNQVKESKLNMLTTSYELFRMSEGESISNMFFPLNQIFNSIHALGKRISNGEMVRKILRSLPP